MTGSAERIDVAVAEQIWLSGDTVLDVRTPEEYASGHVAGALNVPVDTLASWSENQLAGQYLTLCSTGVRAGRAAELLARAGHTGLAVIGGTKAWRAAGLPISTGSEPGSRTPQGRFTRPRG